MPVNTLSIDLPTPVADVFGQEGDVADSILTAAVVKWYELGRISHGKAAELLGLSRAEFLDLLTTFEVSAWQYGHGEIERELALD